jgi:uncharacterized protein YndB with AHSA1/START domain
MFEILTTVTFEAQGGKTNLTVRNRVVMATPQAAGPLAGMEMGWSQTLDRLGEEFVR